MVKENKAFFSTVGLKDCLRDCKRKDRADVSASYQPARIPTILGEVYRLYCCFVFLGGSV